MTDLRRLVTALAVVGGASAFGWIGWGVFGWAVAMLAGAGVIVYLGFRPTVPKSQDDNSGEVVPVARVPNVPLADVVVAELRENGIEAFYKVLGVGGIVAASSVTTPGNQCEVYVQRADAQRAQSLVPQ